MKKYFLTGFITLLPIALTIIIGVWLFNLFTAPFAGITESIIHAYEESSGISLQQHDKLVAFLSRVFAFIFLLALIFILGFLGRKFFFNLLLNITDRIFSRIPLVRTIYRLSNDITKAFFADSKKTFKETVLIPFPHLDSHTIGFVTGDAPEVLKKNTGVEIAIFIPTAPHPMSGYVLLSSKKLVVPVDVSVEDAFKFLISCGVVHPGESSPSQTKN